MPLLTKLGCNSERIEREWTIKLLETILPTDATQKELKVDEVEDVAGQVGREMQLRKN